MTDSNSRRLTRSTYIDEPTATNGTTNHRKTRSTSTDSENGWIPPPPLLPLHTKFLITNPQPSPSNCLPPLSPPTSKDAISSRIAIAHFKCHPSSSSSGSSSLPGNAQGLSANFRILPDREIIRPRSADRPNSNGLENSSEFILLESKLFSQLHRQSEMIEKRSKNLEKEKLLHERFKLKNRLDVLIKGSGADWKSVRTLTLRRIKEDERRQRSAGALHPQSNQHHPRETEWEKVERMRHILIQETEETLKRYDKLLDTRKQPKARSGTQLNEPKPANQSSTPSKSRLKPVQNRTTPKSSKRKQTEQVFSDPDQPQKSTKLTHHPPSSKLKESIQSSNPIPSTDPNIFTDSQEPTQTQQLFSSSSPLTCHKSPHPQPSQPVPVQGQTLKSRSIPPPSRESLYDSDLIRASAMDEQFLNGQKRVGRLAYALGCKLPDLNAIQLDYLPRLRSMASSQSGHAPSTPFDRPERNNSISIQTNAKPGAPNVQANDEDDQDWIEFNPTVNEEKEIISHQAEFGLTSVFFELDVELEYLEEKKMMEYQKNHPSNSNLGICLDQTVLGGKSIRKLIEERMCSWEG